MFQTTNQMLITYMLIIMGGCGIAMVLDNTIMIYVRYGLYHISTSYKYCEFENCI